MLRAVSYILAQPRCDFSIEITQSLKHHTKPGSVSCLTETSLYKSSSGQNIFDPSELQATPGISKNPKIFSISLFG